MTKAEQKVRLPAKIKILVCAQSDDVISPILTVPDVLTGAVIEVLDCGVEGLTDDIVRQHNPDVLVVDVRLDNTSDLERLSHFAQQADSSLYVIATSQDSNVEGIRRLLSLRINDFLPQPINPEEFIHSLQNAARKVRQMRPTDGSQIITFLHCSGGAGATTLAVNSALALMKANKASSVCILDMDLQFGQVAPNLDLAFTRGILDIIENPGRLDTTFMNVVMTSHKSGVDVLAAPDALLQMDSLSPELVGRMLNVAMELYDYVIIDMPIGLTPWSQIILGRSSAVVVVGKYSVPGVRQMRRLISILVADGAGDLNLMVVFNRYLGRWKGPISAKVVEKTLGRKIDFLITNDHKTATKALDQGVSLWEVSRRSKLVRDIRRMVDGILNKIKAQYE